MAEGISRSSTFDFSDQFGSDPVMRRYRPVDYMDIRAAESAAFASEAAKQEAEANLARSKAELESKLAPMKFAQDQFKSMADMMKTKSELEESAAVQQGAAVISDGLSKAKNLDEVVSLGSNNSLGLRDSVVGAKWRVNVLGGFRQLIDNAQSVAEVQAAHAKLPASIAFEPEFKGLYDNGLAQAEKREEVRRSFAAEPSLGAVPTTTAGGVDVTAAGLAIAAEGGKTERRNIALKDIEVLQKRLDDLRDDVKEKRSRGEEPTESDTMGVETLRRQIQLRMTEAGIIPSEAATDLGAPAATPTSVDSVGSLLPPEANRGAGAPAAAAASTAATGVGETPQTTQPIPDETLKPKSLAERAEQAASAAAPKKKALEGRAALAAKAKEKRDIANRIQILRDERSRLQSAIFQKKGRGGGGSITTRLKPGLALDNDVVKETLARIEEITAELGE